MINFVNTEKMSPSRIGIYIFMKKTIFFSTTIPPGLPTHYSIENIDFLAKQKQVENY
jgi:hypothetical protein